MTTVETTAPSGRTGNGAVGFIGRTRSHVTNFVRGAVSKNHPRVGRDQRAALAGDCR